MAAAIQRADAFTALARFYELFALGEEAIPFAEDHRVLSEVIMQS